MAEFIPMEVRLRTPTDDLNGHIIGTWEHPVLELWREDWSSIEFGEYVPTTEIGGSWLKSYGLNHLTVHKAITGDLKKMITRECNMMAHMYFYPVKCVNTLRQLHIIFVKQELFHSCLSSYSLREIIRV